MPTPKTVRDVLLIEGCRTPFLKSGTQYGDLLSYDLGRMAVAGLLHKTRVDPDRVDMAVMGTVVGEPKTTNLAREVVIGTGLPEKIPAYTVTMACVSSLQAILDGARAIAAGEADLVIAGGAELLSDVPIRYPRPMRKRLIAASKAKGFFSMLGKFKGFRLRMLKPEAPAIAEYSTGETMGQNAERLAKRFEVTREEQDEFALASHLRAAKAAEEGLLDRQIVPSFLPRKFEPITKDNGVRGDTTKEKLARLRPVFDRRFGTVSAGNSSFLTDGGSAVLLASEDIAEKLNLDPLAYIRSTSVTAMDPREELLLGPAFTTPRVLEKAGLKLDDVGVLEYHEAFAAQMVANLRILESDDHSRDILGLEEAVGKVDRDKLNAWGGSLSVGHPFGATGARLVTNAAHRMEHDQARYGLVAACAAGAIGIGMVLERP